MKATSVCLCVLRWGGWPGWMPLVVRQWSVQRAITFMLLSDELPMIAGPWPRNVRLLNISLNEMRNRLQRAMPPSPHGEPPVRVKRLSTFSKVVGVSGTNSKISDFKPFLGQVLKDELRGCAFWGYLQEDVLLGNLRSFLTEELLGRIDTISPLAPPKWNFGPFMIYRNSPGVTSLPYRSTQWRVVVNERKYLTFDEWWSRNISDHMPAVIAREQAAGRLRAFAAADGSQQWICDSFLYAAASDGSRSPVYDERVAFSWRLERGGARLTTGAPATESKTASTIEDQGRCADEGCCVPRSPPLALVHLHGMRQAPALRLTPSAELRDLSSRATSAVVTRLGIFLQADGEDTFTWFSALFSSTVRVRTVDLAASLTAITKLEGPKHGDTNVAGAGKLARKVEMLQPCVLSPRLPTSAPSAGNCPGQCIRVHGNVETNAMVRGTMSSVSCYLNG